MPFITLKNYTKKVNINSLFSRINSFEANSLKNNSFLPCFSSKIKFFLYTFLRHLKVQKINNFLNEQKCSFGRKLEYNGFYTSLVEVEKKEKIKVLYKKILDRSRISLKQSILVSTSSAIDNKSLKNLSRGFDKYDRFYGNYLENVEKRRVFLKTLRLKRFFNRVFISRLFSFVAKGRKKYRSNFYYFFRRRRKIHSLFRVYTLSCLKFRDAKKQRKKVFKRLAWKVKKQKRWKSYGSFNLFRLRQRLSQSFYIPKHFEINYKTLGISYLGYTDFRTTNARVPFWLNLRKLITFLS